MSALDTAWRGVQDAATAAAQRRIADLFESHDRAAHFSARGCGMLLDYSKTALDEAARAQLFALARAARLEEARDAMFAGERINSSENRAVLHTALRNPDRPVFVDGTDVSIEIRETLDRMRRFAHDLRAGHVTGAGGAAITDVVNIGIGGSDLGPVMSVHALAPWHDGPRCHFISNVDGADATDSLRGLDPATTLVIVASKSFTTTETMVNAQTVRRWMAETLDDPAAQFVALSSRADRAAAFGIPSERVFGFGDYVGGRYSVWGPIGLSLMLAVGPENFESFLAGGAAMDAHFCTAPLEENLPVILALTGIWHHQGMGYPTRAVLPYEYRLAHLPAYLQQLEMESNGKHVGHDGAPLTHGCGPVVWGAPGTNGQHAFFQLLHQGTEIVPCEFLIARAGNEAALEAHHRLLQANCLAQSEALMRGRSLSEARAIVAAEGLSGAALERQAAQRVFEGNRPSVTIAYPRLTPQMLGQIVALYEHRVFAEGVILGLNSFDQWGVELGKELARALEPVLAGREDAASLDGSTRALVGWLTGEE